MGDSIIRDILYQEYPPLGMTDGMLTEPEVPVALATAGRVPADCTDGQGRLYVRSLEPWMAHRLLGDWSCRRRVRRN